MDEDTLIALYVEENPLRPGPADARLKESGVELWALLSYLDSAVGGDLKAVRLALTGRERGPELAAVIAALPREELLRRTASL